MPALSEGGLAVRRHGRGWAIVHEESGLIVAGTLRLRQQALWLQVELLATGVDFTRNRTDLRRPANDRKIKAVLARIRDDYMTDSNL